MAVIKFSDYKKNKFENIGKNELLGNFLSYYSNWKGNKLHHSELIQFMDLIDKLNRVPMLTPKMKKLIEETAIKLKGSLV